MAGSKSDYLENELLDHVLKGSAYTPPTDVYIALFTSSGGLENDTEGSQTELSGSGYARLKIDNSTLAFTTAASGATENNEAWEFAQASGDWSEVSHFAVMDAATSGHVLYWGELTSSVTVTSGNSARFAAGDLTISEA